MRACTICGLDMDLVGKAHRCVPRAKPDVPVQRPLKSTDVQASPRRLLKHGGDRRSDKFQRNAVTLNRGNTANYLLARLERDRSDLAAKVRAKELSAYAAAIEAGFRKRATGDQQKVG
jgi:hypothetical protein